MNKKGAWGDLKNIILALVFGIILLLFTLYLSGGLSDAGNKAACKNWVNMQSSAKLGGIELSPFKSPCITSEEIIKDSDKDKIYEQLARNMYDCWDMYGAGKKDFYSDWFNTDTHCRICSEIKIDEKVTKKRSSINIDDFEVYLSNHNPPNHGETYAEYFTDTESAYIDFGGGEIPLNKEENLYTIFMITKGDAPTVMDNLKRGALLSTVFPLATGIFGGVVGGLAGAGVGSVVPVAGTISGGVSGAIGGFKIGFVVGVAGGFVTYLGKKSYVYPSLLLVTGKESFEKGCEDYYYNLQRKLIGLDIGKKEET